VLGRVVDRARAMGFEPMMAVELEIRMFREDQESLRAKSYTGLRPLNPGLNCYSISHASVDEDVVGGLRRQMDAYGIPVEGYNREHGEGMYEMNLHYTGALEAADRGMLFKSGAKEVLAQAGAVPTFMAKYSDELDGCSGHIHQSLWRDGAPDGETAAEVGARADRVIADIRSTDGDVALFAHGHLLRVLTARWLGLEPSEGRLFALEPGTISILGYERETSVIRLWNEPVAR
jgi:glutamine synthetase